MLTLLAGISAATALLAAAVASGGHRYAPYPSDAIVVLGAAVWPGPRPSPALRGRAEKAAQLYTAGLAPYVITTGGSAGSRPTEAHVAAQVLQELGVPPSAILIEPLATSTEQSALYVGRIMRERGWSRVLVVSDSYHLTRSVWLFKRQGFQTSASAADDWYYSTGSRIYHVLRETVALSYLLARDLYQAMVGLGAGRVY